MSISKWTMFYLEPALKGTKLFLTSCYFDLEIELEFNTMWFEPHYDKAQISLATQSICILERNVNF